MLKCEKITTKAGSFRLEPLDLEITQGECHTLLGPSGAGKSTALELIVGFRELQSGRIILNGRNLENVPVEQRNIGYLPQNMALFPHLTVKENILYGIRSRRKPDKHDIESIDSLTEAMGVKKLENRKPLHLSGGERQRVALARALAPAPELLILDEPFSALNESLRSELSILLKELQQTYNLTTIIVTHDLEEAFFFSEKIHILINGRLHQSGPKNEIFNRPITASVARFLNYRNIFEGITEDIESGTEIKTENFSIFISKRFPPKKRVCFCLRQQDIKVIKKDEKVKESLKRNVFSGKIKTLFTLPEYCLMTFSINGSPKPHDFELKFPRYIIERHNLYEGMEINAAVWEPNIIVFDEL